MVCSVTAGTPSSPLVSVWFPADRVPRQLWARELVWLKNMGFGTVAATQANPEFHSLAEEAGLKIEITPGAKPIGAMSSGALIKSRQEVFANRPVMWTGVESETAPEFRVGAVDVSGEEDASMQLLRREIAVVNYWRPVLESGVVRVENKLPEQIRFAQKETAEASAASVINTSAREWIGDVRVFAPSFHRTLQIPKLRIPAQDALLLPVDVSFADPRFCRACWGMSNSERLVYATAELTGIEYENGILSFEFYAPVAGEAVLQLEREPNGPMLAGGRPIAFDWDAGNKRARLPIPVGRGEGRRMRIAITITGPDDVAWFTDAHTLTIGQTNRILTEYSSEAFAKKARLTLPDGWKSAREQISPTQIAYAIDVPADRLHGDHAELRLEANGVGMSHMRAQLLRPVSLHIAEDAELHFGGAAALKSDPPLVAIDGPNGRSFTLQIRNNAPEIRTFHVALSGDQLEFSPAAQEVSIGASAERELSERVFATGSGVHEATLAISGAAQASEKIRFVTIPRNGTVRYSADLTGTGSPQTVVEDSRLRAVFTRPDGGRWLEFFWKESGRSLLPPEGIALGVKASYELDGNRLSIEAPVKLPGGGHSGNVEWKAEPRANGVLYEVTESTGKQRDLVREH